MLDAPAGFKEQMVEARRTQILSGAAAVFAEKGYHQATTKEIAKAAGVAEGTIYNYFQNKRDLLVAMIDNIGMQSVRDIVTDQPPDDPRQYLTLVLEDRFQIAASLGSRLIPVIAEMLTDEEMGETVYNRIAVPMARYLEDFIEINVEAGRFRQVDPVVATRSLVGAVFVNFALKISRLDARYDKLSEDQLIEQIVSIFLDGLLATEDGADRAVDPSR
jgi:AcrR family transcriptional regulator